MDIRRPLAAAARDPMGVSQRTAVNDRNPPGGRLVEDIVRPQVQENVAGPKEGFLPSTMTRYVCPKVSP